MGVGSGWKRDRLGNIATFQRGFDLPSRLRRPGSYPVVTSAGPDQGHVEFRVKAPGVVTGRYGTVGKVFFVEEDFWPLNTTLFVSDFHGNDPHFISYAARMIDFHEISAKTGVPGVNRNDLHDVFVEIPSTRKEQEAIAKALCDADALIESLEQLIEKKRRIKQGAMQELLAGKQRLPGPNGRWCAKYLGGIALVKTGRCNNQDKETDGAYPFYVRSAVVERINRYSYDGEAIVVPGEGNIGDVVHYVNGRFEAHQRVYVIRNFSDDVVGKYIYFYMLAHFGAHARKNSVKATVDSLRLPTFKDFKILLPPTLDEQAGIAAVLSDIDSDLAVLEAKLMKVRQIRQGMMQELLTGRIRLT